jgi:hypothetical protein
MRLGGCHHTYQHKRSLRPSRPSLGHLGRSHNGARDDVRLDAALVGPALDLEEAGFAPVSAPRVDRLSHSKSRSANRSQRMMITAKG